MSRLSALRANRSAMIEKVAKDFEGTSQGQEDTRFWKLTRDKTGTGSAVIRFLPEFDNDSLPWIHTFSYAFKGPTGKWFIEECPSTIGLESPVLDANRELYATKDEADKKLASSRKRKNNYIFNILVIKDSAHPENEGKVFLFKAGPAIYGMIQAKVKPSFDDIDPMHPYDVDNGANFRLRCKVKDEYPTYEDSTFDSCTPLCGGDESKIEEVLGKMYNLKEFVDPTRFKTYDQLKKKFDQVVNGTAVDRAENRPTSRGEDQARELLNAASKAAEKRETKTVEKVKKQEEPIDSDTEEDMAYFEKLLAET